MTTSGHFHDPADSGAKSRFCDLYEDLWIAWGATRLHQQEIARATLDFCVRHLSDRHGGVSSIVGTVSRRSPSFYDLRSTALTGITALAQDRTDIAKACALFVTQLIQAQAAESPQFFLVCDEKGDIITKYPEGLARIFVISRVSRTSDAVPLYYALALAVIFMTQLYCVTANPEHLDSAERYAIVCNRHADFIYNNHYSGKVAWALSYLASISSDPAYLEQAVKAITYMLSNQQPSGAWALPTLFPNFDDQPLAATIDRTSEYVLIAHFVDDLIGTPLSVTSPPQ